MPRAQKSLKSTDYKGIIKLMSEGALNCDLMSALEVGKTTFYNLLKSDPELAETYEKGLAKCEKYYFNQYLIAMDKAEDNKERLKHLLNILTHKFKWTAKEFESANTQINIGNVTVFQTKTREETLEFIKDELQEQGLISTNDPEPEYTEFKLIESKPEV